MRDLQGQKVDFNALIAGKSAVVLLLPKIGASAKFLPAEYENFAGLTGCSNQCAAYQSELTNFRQKGYEIYAISSLDVTAMAEFRASLGVDFEFYSDSEFELENLLALKTLQSGNGKKFYHRQTLIFKDRKLVDRLDFIAEPKTDATNVLAKI